MEMQDTEANGVNEVNDGSALPEPNGRRSTNLGAETQTTNNVNGDDSALGEPNERSNTNEDTAVQGETFDDAPTGAEMLSEHLAHYVDDDDDDNDSGLGDIGQKKIPKITKATWFPLEIFDTENQLYDFMKKEHFSKKKIINKSKTATNTLLRCTLVKKNGPQCATRLCLKEFHDDTKFHVLTNQLAHTHDEIANKIAPEACEKIKQFRTLRLRPQQSLAIVNQEFGEDYVNINQVYYHGRCRDNESKINFETVGDLIEWLESNSTRKGDDDPYVLKYCHSGYNDKSTEIQYVITTPRLLKTLSQMKILSTDGTYKVNKHDYPLIVLGAIDINQRLHVIAFSVTSRETMKNYQFLCCMV